ncbi:hypothetical protein [Paracidovorax citrulli]
MAPPNEHRWASRDADELERGASSQDTGFLPPLSRDALRGLYQQNRSPEVRALLWEVARLHAVVRRAAQLSACFPLYEGQANHPAFHTVLEALRRDLAREPCLAEMEKDGQHNEIVSVDLHAGRRRRQ